MTSTTEKRFLRSPPFRVFCSYSHRDDRYRQRLVRSLAPLRREGLITHWDDTQIDAGDEWLRAIRHQLDSADVILLLVSADFINSDFCYGEEMTRALQRHDEGSALVIPIIAQPVVWDQAPFSKLQALPTGGRPLAVWKPLEKGFTDVVVHLRQALLAGSEPASTSPVPPAPGSGAQRRTWPPYSKRTALCVGFVMLAGIIASVSHDTPAEPLDVAVSDPTPTVTTTAPFEPATAVPPTTAPALAPTTTRVAATLPTVTVTAPSPPPTTTTATTPAPSAAEWEPMPQVDLTNRCSATRNVGNFHWQTCVIGSRGALVVSVTLGANHYVATTRISTAVGGSFSPGRACRTRPMVPDDKLVCYAEPGPSTPGLSVRGYGGVVHDTIVEAPIYSPTVTL